MRTLLALAVFVTCAACALGPDETAQPALDTSKSADVAPQTMVLHLNEATPETVTSQIVVAAHEQLAAACVQQPIAFVRVFNPLASGAYVDVPCTEIIGAGAATGEADETLASERIGEAQQRWSPVGIVCALVLGAMDFGFHYGKSGATTHAQRIRRHVRP